MSMNEEATASNRAAHLIEEKASMWLASRAKHAAAPRRESFDVVVIGGGQAGLSVGYHLARAGARFTILDSHQRIGDAWRRRWDSLRLFTAAKYDGLDGMPFPAPRDAFPTKDEMADYLEAYAARFKLPVRTGVRVERLSRHGSRYLVQAGSVQLEAAHVVIAMAGYQTAKVPAFAGALSPEIIQMHSSDYRNPAQLRPGGVALAGAGNSGADIAMETARAGHPTWLSGSDVGHVPFRIDSLLGRQVLGPLLLKLVFHRLLTVTSPLGRRARPGVLARATPLIRVKPSDLSAAHVQRLPRIVGVQDGRPLIEGGRVLDIANVIWCTGYRAGLEWIALPVFDEEGEPLHRSGVVESEPGLYFVGLKFLHAMSSSMIQGVGRDAARIVKAITARTAVAPVAASSFAAAPATRAHR